MYVSRTRDEGSSPKPSRSELRMAMNTRRYRLHQVGGKLQSYALGETIGLGDELTWGEFEATTEAISKHCMLARATVYIKSSRVF